MVPRKNRPVLFEVVARSQRSRGRTGPQRPPTPPTPAAPPPPVTPSVAPTPIRRAPGGQRRHPAVRVADGHVYLALNWPHVLVVGVVLLVVLFLTYRAGRSSAQSSQSKPSAIDNVLSGAPETQAPPPEPAPPTATPRRSTPPVVAVPGPAQPADQAEAAKPPPSPKPTPTQRPQPPAPAPKEKETPETVSFTANSYYVVIQHFRTRDRDKADAAREFLRTKGVSCVVRTGGGDLELVATEAFTSEPQAQDLVRRILALGKEYWNSGGGYEFTGAKARKF